MNWTIRGQWRGRRGARHDAERAGPPGRSGPAAAEALRIYTELNDPRGVAQCLEALAHVASERTHYESAARLIGAAAALREQVAARQPDTEQARTLSVGSVLARALGPQDADTLIHAGRTMPAHQAADLAIAVASGTAPADPDRSHQVPLTPRERQVAALVASGRTNRQIGRVLGISEKTAEVHLHHVMSKLDAAAGPKWPPGPSRITCPLQRDKRPGPGGRPGRIGLRIRPEPGRMGT